MNSDDPLQDNIRRTTAVHTLKKIRRIVDEENADDAFKARALRAMARYGWLAVALVATLLAHLLGVF